MYGGEDDYGNYGDDYGSDDEYGCEDVGKGKGPYGGGGMGMMPDIMGGLDEGDYFGADEDEDDYEEQGMTVENEEQILLGDLMQELEDPNGEKSKREMLANIMR